jgi:hypothetical protein
MSTQLVYLDTELHNRWFNIKPPTTEVELTIRKIETIMGINFPENTGFLEEIITLTGYNLNKKLNAYTFKFEWYRALNVVSLQANLYKTSYGIIKHNDINVEVYKMDVKSSKHNLTVYLTKDVISTIKSFLKFLFEIVNINFINTSI